MARRFGVGAFFFCETQNRLLRLVPMISRVPPTHSVFRAIALISLAMMLGACSRGSDEGETVERQAVPAKSSERPAIESLPGVELDALPAGTREIYLRTVHDLLSPCNEPISLARCVSDGSSCRLCPAAARYLARMAAKGFGEDELRALYLNRYGEETKVELPVEGAPIKGALMAPVTIVEFSDFQCPSCRHAAPLLDQAVRALDGKVRLVFKNFPLSHHPFSEKAARAALAAERQGKFWEYHDLIFENQHRLDDLAFEAFARQLKLDLDRFKADFESSEIRERVSRDRSDGIAAGVGGTPAVFVNGREYLGSLDDLIRYLEEELDA